MALPTFKLTKIAEHTNSIQTILLSDFLAAGLFFSEMFRYRDCGIVPSEISNSELPKENERKYQKLAWML